ncbi:hypothetical protein JTE90_024432 [Oedothorax gibbosus]|uniref:Uncharacterized protein n=1 Tax=Oedothorax gibbosus TaxID=931172 RepID=A0AAV6UH84_9ARAC|nr:hypothetical protein JTE90_024432 [Oedothorax gibbosus]
MSSQKRNPDSASVSRSQSREVLDSSSTSSLSVFADHSDGPISGSRMLEANAQKSGECSPSQASVDEALKSEAAFIQYLTSIPAKEPELRGSSDCVPARNRSPAVGSSNPSSKVGLDHLDNLCKLMEQLGELRDNNSKLQKRVQYLEDLKTLHDMHKEICEGVDYSSEDALSPKPQTGNFPLQKSATETHCPKRQLEEEEDDVPTEVLSTGRSPSRYLSRRSRHQQSGGQVRRCRSKSVGHEDLGDPKSRRIFPKWSRVKEAFGWESERKGSIKKDDSAFASRRRSDESRQTYRHLGRTSWYQECPSVQSSTEDINECNEDLKEKSFTLERDPYSTPEFAKFYKEDVKRGKSPWGRVKTIIERHRDSLKRRSLRRDQSATDLDSAICKNVIDPLDFKAYDEFLDSQEKLPSPSKPKKNSKKPSPLVLEQEDCACPRTPSSSPNLQRKSRWNRVTQVWKGKKEGDKDSMSTPNTPNFQKDGNFTFDVIEEMSPDSQGETREMSRVGSDSHVNQLSMAMPSTEIMLQLQRNLSEDFHRKIMEWDRIRASSGTGSSPSNFDGKRPSEASRSRKKSGPRDDKAIKPKLKDLTWLEKELQKIEKEKQRLAKERQKYEERARRLEKLKETVLNANSSNKREVLVRTSAGEFRFEGISDAFTKKLYEWETKRGVGPELSTIALLDSSRLTAQPVKIGSLQRVLSRSESSIAEIGQPSHNSSNSLPSVKMPDEVERVNQTSRANSEPDLATLAAFTNGTGMSVLRQSSEVTDADLPSPEVSKESEEDEFDKPRKGSETYYSLLEENVILLEQLKEKEDICRRLENDLGVLDEKMDDMNNRHLQETQRYREKLWEMHQQGATPRDVLCCRRTMEQLRKRIETLEKWTKKLRSDRDTIEINFRHHSKEQETMTLDLLGKMRELQAVESSAAATDMRDSPRMDSDTVERLQDLSALLTKQTLDLEERLSEKTRQICHLKWELLHRDLSDVKLETEQHTHSANKKRSKYANWRSRSSEEPTATAGGPQKTDSSNFELVATEVYGGPTTPDELKATYLANTVQQLNKELLKLTSNASISSLSKYFDEDSSYANAVAPPKPIEVSRLNNKTRVPAKASSRKITVRRSSAGNLNLVSTDDNRKKEETTSTTESDGSSDDYYSRVSYNSGHKSNFSSNQNQNGERLLMSYGEHAPRASNSRKKKFQKLNSSLSRKRSNTFHTNRDLQKPNIGDNVPQKCQSFRVARENYLEDSLGDKTAYSRRKIQNSHFNIRSQDIANYKTKMDQKFQEAALLRKSMGKVGVLENYNINWLREVASDSKLPILLQAQITAEVEDEADISCHKCPTRSMSDKTKNETAAERREHLQKRRTKKRLKSPDPISSNQIITGSNINSNLENVQPFNIPKHCELQNLNSSVNCCQIDSHNNAFTVKRQDSLKSIPKEIPTITIQLPKRKHRKSSCTVVSANEVSSPEEQTFTIIMPKKRSLSSECESSISENSPRDPSILINSDQRSDSPDSSCWLNTTERSSTAPQLNVSSHTQVTENGNIRLMRLVSLNNFESPFDKNSYLFQKEVQHTGQYPNKRKAEGDIDESPRLPIESCMISNREAEETNRVKLQNNSNISSGIEQGHTSETHYVKSPSAPQLDWRKVCAKKVSKSGAPNVRTLIERYNQKMIESQLPKSPISSNVSSPATPRKISNPVGSCSSPTFVPRFCSTPNTPTSSPSHNPLIFSSSSTSFTKSPPSSPASVARAMALSKAKEHFIASQSSTPTSPVISPRFHIAHGHSSESTPTPTQKSRNDSLYGRLELRRLDDDGTSNSSMDSMNIVMMRAGENCRESRLPKRPTDAQRNEASSSCDRNNLKTSKSLSSSSLFKSVLNSEFKMPSSLLRLKRSKRKKDMSTVTELCRQSLLLTTDDVQSLPPAVSHKSCPNSPELKLKTIVKSSWLQRNIFRHK